MKYFYPLVLFPALSTFAQEETTIQQWQSAHPATQLITTERYTTLSEEEKQLLGTNYILFTGTVTMAQLLEATPADQPFSPANPEEAQFIKDWIAAHPEVQIIPKSHYLRANEEERSEFEQANAMILEGETVTLNDVINYN